MNQLVVLQEIFESFSTGGNALSDIDPESIEGNCSEQVGKLLERAKLGRIDEDLCSKLADNFLDVYEIKRLGDICRRAGLYSLAIKCYNKALSMTRDQNVRPVLLNNLGQVYSRQADPGRAAVYYQKAADGFELMGDQSGLAHILGNLGASYRRSKDWDKAVEHCYRSLKTFEEIGDEFGAAQMTGSLGRIYAEMGERDLAARYFEKSLLDFQRLGDKKSVARVLDRMGWISAQSRNWDEAIRYYNKSIAIFNELGQERSSGIVLSHLGRMYLEKGEAVSARDTLDRALKLMRKDMQPAYQNAVASIAASYSLIAKSHLGKADDLSLASQYFARASDRYQELSSFPKTNLPQIKVAASVARSHSYIAKLQAKPSEIEAVNLAERSILSLDSAVANSEGTERMRIAALKKILTGMKEVWSAGLLGIEPWRMTKSLANSAEYMLGGACNTGEANICLCDALQALSGAVEAEKRRDAPIEQLKAAASHLRRAEKRLQAEKSEWSHQSVLHIGQAAVLIEGLISQEISQSAASQSRISDLVQYKAHREALLHIGWVMAKNALHLADNTSHVFAWDEAFNLIERPCEECGIAEPENEANATEIELEVEPVQFQDAFEKRIGTMNAENEANPEGLWLIPVKSSLAQSFGPSQMLVARDRHTVRNIAFEKVEIVEPQTVVEPKTTRNTSERMGIMGLEDSNDNLGFGKAKDRMGEVSSDAGRDSIGDAKNELKAWKEGFSAILGGIINSENAVKIIRALMIVVMVLLAIKVILYLI
jgi:tetratricopeptide (TPR) repeat protein